MRIVFMGTPAFAVPALDILVKNGYTIAGVITAPDKPAGRGQKLLQSAVKEYAVANNLPLLQPEKLKNEAFLSELKALNADLQIVVAFRMLPEVVWNMPPLGTLNLHASLLPQYRGAAPINWALINGETETGVSTFFLKQEIDTGNIIFSEKVAIHQQDTAGTLHDKLMETGSGLILKTVKAIENKTAPAVPQVATTELKIAPKLFKPDCEINWKRDCSELYNFVRGLSPYPAAFTTLNGLGLKIYSCTIEEQKHNLVVGTPVSDNKTYLKFACNNGFIAVTELQLEGKKRMPVAAFLMGYKIAE